MPSEYLNLIHHRVSFVDSHARRRLVQQNEFRMPDERPAYFNSPTVDHTEAIGGIE